jgi:iron-sulfur cluster assembly protein
MSRRVTPDPEVTGPAIAPTAIHCSTAALEQIRDMLEEEDLLEEGGLRLSARSGAGCSAPLQFGMILETAPDPEDVVLLAEGIRIFLDPSSAWALDGLRVDYVDSPLMGSGFAFQHPRGAGGRAC